MDIRELMDPGKSSGTVNRAMTVYTLVLLFNIELIQHFSGNVTIFTDPEVYNKVPYLWVIFAIMFATLFLPSIIIVR